jgi:hypothetical protein
MPDRPGEPDNRHKPLSSLPGHQHPLKDLQRGQCLEAPEADQSLPARPGPGLQDRDDPVDGPPVPQTPLESRCAPQIPQ